MYFKMPKPGDTIMVVSLASAISKESERFPVMEKYLEQLGFKIKYGKCVGGKHGYLAGADSDRVADLHEAFLDNEVTIVLSMLGGFGCSRIVDLVDYEIIKNNPKLFIGFSDITVFLNAINQKTNIPTIHGALGVYLGNPSFGEFSYLDFKKLIFEKQKNRVLENPNDLAQTLIPGIAKGKLVGGNLTLINTLLGTDFEIDFKDKIVFIEEVDEEPYRIDRYLSSLRLANKLQEANGFVFGYFTNCNPKDQNSWTYIDLIKQYFGDLKIPIIYNFASGHSFPFINLPIGLEVELDANKKTITILEELYEAD